LEEGALEGVVVGQRINWRLVMTRTLSGSGFSLLLLGCHPLFLLFTSFHSGQNRAFLSPITINNKGSVCLRGCGCVLIKTQLAAVW